MQFVTSEQIPGLFEAKMAHRRPEEHAAVASMNLALDDNLVTESLVRYGTSHDVLAVDNYGHKYGYTPRLSIVGFVPSHYHDPNQFIERFAGEYVVLNEPRFSLPPFDAMIGRSHIKFYRVGDWVLSLGGVNCSPYSYYNNTDGMVSFDSPDFRSFTERFVEARGDMRARGVGEEIVLDTESKVFVDYGKRRQSLILDGVYQDVERPDVDSIVHSSNYIPFGRMDQALVEHGESGAKVEVYANHPHKFLSNHHSNLSVFAHYMAMYRNKSGWVDNDPERFNHLKAIIITYKNGERIMWIGSHNFNTASVAAGTAEVALRTVNQELIDEVAQYIEENLGA